MNTEVKLLSFASFYLNEARQQNLEYNEKLVKGEIDKVIVELSGKESAAATRLAKKFKSVKDAAEKLKLQQEELNADAKALVADYFDAADETATRVLNTCSLTITVSKAYTRETTKVDYEAILEQISELVPELQQQFAEIVKANTKISKSNVTSSLKVTESTLHEGVLDKLKTFLSDLLTKVKMWAKSYDAKLSAIEKQLT